MNNFLEEAVIVVRMIGIKQENFCRDVGKSIGFKFG